MHADRTRPKDRAVARDVDGADAVSRMRVVAWVVLACALVLARPVGARAGWPLAAPGRVMLGFGAVYSAGEGDSSRHRGTDIEAGAGDCVAAPLSGTVTFAGKVPGVGGGRVTAVTIDTARGKITLLPLEQASVSRGASVAEGDAVGTLAGSGDGSSASTHLHVGAREGDLYIDPLGLMAPPPVPAEGGSGAGAAVGAPSGAEAGAAVPMGAGVSAGVSLAPGAGSASATRVSRAGKTAASGELAPGVSVAVGSATQAGVAAAPGMATVAGAGGLSAAAGAPQATVLTRDGVVVAVSAAAAPRPVAHPVWSAIVPRVRAYAQRSLRLASLVLLGVMGAIGALWPLWRGQKGSGKVLVSAVIEDVAAAPSR